MDKVNDVKTCEDCQCSPCQCKIIAKARRFGSKICDSCDTDLGLRGGYNGTGLCGPCCTGESDTLDKKFIDW